MDDVVAEEKVFKEILTSESPYYMFAKALQSITRKFSSYDTDSYFDPFNPDDLYQKDHSYQIYEEMMRDDQVSLCMQLKKDITLCSGFDFIAGDDGQEEIIKDLKIAFLEDTDWPFEEQLDEILSAYEFGFSLTEKVFRKREDGSLTLQALLTRHPGPWLIHMDESGMIERYEQQIDMGSIDIPKEVLIHYINKRKFQNPYGVSDLRPAYAAWFMKKHITRWYGIFIEKAGSPIPIGKYKRGSTAEKDKQALHNALKKFMAKSTMVIPDDYKVDFLEAKNNGDVFIKGINLFNMLIGRSTLMPDLLGLSGSETSGGAYALGKEQMELFFKHINRRRTIIERIVNQHLVWPIVLHNWGFIDNYPKFKLRPISKDETMEAVKLWLDATKSHIYEPGKSEIDHFRNIINFPTDDIERVDEPIEAVPGEDEIETEVDIIPTEDGDDSAFASKRPFKDPGGDYSRKVDIKRIESEFNSGMARFKGIVFPLIDEMLADMEDQIGRRKIIEQQKVSRVDSIKLKGISKIKTALTKDLHNQYKTAKEIAASEIFQSSFAKPIVDDKFLEILEKENFDYIGDWEYKITQKARLAMIQAIKDGTPLQDVAGIRDEAKASMERYARTKFTEVMNKGRIAFFEQSKVVAGYQYSAILDDRTTEICRGLHGKKFKAGNQPVPPMHFNCRSIVIPITIFESFEPDKTIGKTPIERFIDEKKGQGFPKQ